MKSQKPRFKETERLLRESEERFRLLYENAPLAYQSLDENGCFLEVNQTWLDMLGYSRDEVVGKWCGDFLSPSYKDKFKAYFPQFKAAGEIHGLEFELVKKDGSTVLISVDGKIGRDRQERFQRTHCILHDITGRKQAERRLLLLNFALDHVREAVYLIDENARFLYVNEEACRALRYSRRELVGRMSVLDIGPGWTEERWSDHWRELKGHGSLTFEAFHETKDGHVFPVEITANIFHYDGTDYNVALARDITERKRGIHETLGL